MQDSDLKIYLENLTKVLSLLEKWLIETNVLPTDKVDDRWITSRNGSHILLDDNGEIKDGLGGEFDGMSLDEVGTRSTKRAISPGKRKSESRLVPVILSVGGKKDIPVTLSGFDFDEKGNARQSSLKKVFPSGNQLEQIKKQLNKSAEELVDTSYFKNKNGNRLAWTKDK